MTAVPDDRAPALAAALADLTRFRKQYPEEEAAVGGARWGVVDTAPNGRARNRPTLLLLPGTLGTAEIYWQQVRALSRRMRLIALTYPAVPDVERFADGAVRILRAKGIRQAHVLGSSLGGYTAQVIAQRHPDFVQRLLIGNSLCNPQSRWHPQHPPLEEMEAMPARELKAQRLARLEGWADGDAGLALAKAVVGRQGHERISARHLKARVVALLRAPDLAALPLPDARITVIECDDDPVMTPPVRRDLRAHYPGAKVHTLPTGGHFPYLSRAEAYTAILQQTLLD